jgi:hypothetical protein
VTEAPLHLTYYSFTNKATDFKPRKITGLLKAANMVKVPIWKYP